MDLPFGPAVLVERLAAFAEEIPTIAMAVATARDENSAFMAGSPGVAGRQQWHLEHTL